jgi:hypothetical protein
MDRRSFLKLSTLFAAAMAIESSPILKTIANSTDHTSKALLYLIQNKNGQWKVLWSRYSELDTKKINSKVYNIETFKPLEIVDAQIANQRRDNLWVKYKCSGQKGFPVNPKQVLEWQKLSYMHPNTLAYSRSKENIDRLFKVVQTQRAKRAGKKNVESGHWDSIKYLGPKAAHDKIRCPHCGHHGSTVNIKRHHFENCQQNIQVIDTIFSKLNYTFNKTQLKNAVIESGYNQNFVQALLRNDNILTMIHKGTIGSTKNVNIYQQLI